MNKQKLASRIWESANKMRSKIEANEYKDYILGFIFYKYLSDNEVKKLKEQGFTQEDIEALVEEDAEVVKYVRENVGYFIAYKDLFSTWLKMGKDFDVSNVTDALSAFNRLINPSHKKVYEGIFNTLQTGLSKLGDSSASRTKAISDLIHLIKDIPMDGRQDYDIIGFIYEYLISMFAANAGKKAGEFYTPHEVSILMSEIVADHLKDRTEIEIYDPTSGSGSLLINIGRSVAKHIDDERNIKYYAQELKQNTYNLTRMNLVMRGILPANIITRNGDTLEDDWPYFDESNQAETYNPLYVDAVVSNPPYSQHWDPSNKETDPRYARFGLAPKAKADFAFLLHDLFHIKPEGIMTIVLPHGVLFRGGEEGEIRKNLIEENHIDAIIGLPPNIFFGTNIPTIIMILKQKRENTDVLIIDASKGFTKIGKNNKLRASDIKKIVDIVAVRADIDKFSKKINRETIRRNEYNLNIPRYVDSSEDVEKWDLYASMFGGIPMSEIDKLIEYWSAFPELKEVLFTKGEGPYTDLAVSNIEQTIEEHPAVNAFISNFKISFESFGSFLKSELITNMATLNISKEKAVLSDDIFERLDSIPLINRYEAYQLLDDEWAKTSVDLEIIQTEGFNAVKKVNPNMVIKKKDGKEEEVQEGWIGHIIPFELVQRTLLLDEYEALKQKEGRLVEISSEYDEILDSLSEEEKDSSVTNDSSDAFVVKEVGAKLKEIYADVDTQEIKVLKDYATLSKKADKLAFISAHNDVVWSNMDANKDGTYSKKAVNAYLAELQSAFKFPEDSFEAKIVKVSKMMAEEKEVKAQVKADAAALHLKTKETIESLSDEQALELLEQKWIFPLVESIKQLPNSVIHVLVDKIKTLSEKYAVTYSAVESEIQERESTLSALIGELNGNEYEMKGLSELMALLKGE
ncbi:type I restriction-modification system subunit M [Bacillus pumilus]|uniref:type I restriction-modification system subunit M n=1 Tax=Bacillus TaxID=1386 RepID=UPI000D0262D5|nr:MULTISPECIES: type I restriction-modification system subunit M [Bacillus]AZV53623.1 type I restriction-modification system subunit M [Bacillus pumilus]MDG4728356.1 type I restriction-modification system subunit M [Bacillus pumilus]PRS52221.1 type I restriction-modification system subunit M [Bacillus sp. GBSC66]PRS72226.1 type I restriction-modification system subunit M [Bacillus sp. NMTD17]